MAAQGSRSQMFGTNLPRPEAPMHRVDAVAGARLSTNQYPRARPRQYQGPDCPGTFARDSLLFPYRDTRGAPSLAQPEPTLS